MASFGTSYDLGELAKHLLKARTSKPGVEDVSFDGVLIDEVRAVLSSCVTFHDSVPDIDVPRLVWTSIVETARQKNIDAGTLRAAVHRTENRYLGEPEEAYVLLTSINFPRPSTRRRYSVDGSVITLTDSAPSQFDIAPVRQRAEQVARPDLIDKFPAVRIHVRARTPGAAASLALARFDTLRALWNLKINLGVSRRVTTGKRMPVNQLVRGPLHTLHRPNGELAANQFWYELPHGQNEDFLAKKHADWPVLDKGIAGARRRLRTLAYAEHLKALLVRYVRALDTIDYDLTFGGLWGVVEHLTDSVGEYEKLVRRVTFLYSDPEFVRQVAQHLRDVRNSLVHHDREHAGMEMYVFQLKGFAEELFRLHFSRGRPFASLQDAADFLDSPIKTEDRQAERERLRQRIKRLDDAERYRKGGHAQ